MCHSSDVAQAFLSVTPELLSAPKRGRSVADVKERFRESDFAGRMPPAEKPARTSACASSHEFAASRTPLSGPHPPQPSQSGSSSRRRLAASSPLLRYPLSPGAGFGAAQGGPRPGAQTALALRAPTMLPAGPTVCGSRAGKVWRADSFQECAPHFKNNERLAPPVRCAQVIEKE